MLRRGSLVALCGALALFLPSCSNPAAAPVDRAAPGSGDEGDYLTVTLSNEGGSLALLDTTIAHLAYPPMVPTTGSLVVVGWAGDTVVDAAFAEFPTELLGETFTEEDATPPTEVIPADGGSVTVVRLRADQTIERLTVLDDGGNEVAALPVPHDDAMPLTSDDVWFPLEEYPIAVLRTDASVSILPPAMRERLRGVVDPLVDMTPEERDGLIAAMRLSTPAVLEATRYIVIAGFQPIAANLVGFAAGDSFAIRNDFTAPGAIDHVMTHELAHVFDSQLTGQPRDIEQFLGHLPGIVANQVRNRLLERVRRRLFDSSLSDIFGDLMANARAAELTTEIYCAPRASGSCFRGMTDRARVAGIAEPYGLYTLSEDVATWVTSTHANDATGHPVTPSCAAMQTATDYHAPGLLIAYVKLSLVRSAGMITDEDFDRCVGAFPVPRAPGPGIYFERSDGTRFDLTESVEAGWADVDGEDMFSVLASGGPYRGAIQVLTPGRRFPRPIAMLRSVNLVTVDYPINGFFLSHATELGLARGSASGLVIFTSVSAMGVEGLVLFLEIQSEFAVTDHFTIGTFRYDEGT